MVAFGRAKHIIILKIKVLGRNLVADVIARPEGPWQSLI
jgi:hypothetical protein